MGWKLDSDKQYRVGDVKDYTSIYGYPKKMYPIIDVESDETVGHVKEEALVDADGERAVLMYYERNGWRKHGQLRFYTSIEACVKACGGTLVTPAKAKRLAALKKAAGKDPTKTARKKVAA